MVSVKNQLRIGDVLHCEAWEVKFASQYLEPIQKMLKQAGLIVDDTISMNASELSLTTRTRLFNSGGVDLAIDFSSFFENRNNPISTSVWLSVALPSRTGQRSLDITLSRLARFKEIRDNIVGTISTVPGVSAKLRDSENSESLFILELNGKSSQSDLLDKLSKMITLVGNAIRKESKSSDAADIKGDLKDLTFPTLRDKI